MDAVPSDTDDHLGTWRTRRSTNWSPLQQQFQAWGQRIASPPVTGKYAGVLYKGRIDGVDSCHHLKDEVDFPATSRALTASTSSGNPVASPPASDHHLALQPMLRHLALTIGVASRTRAGGSLNGNRTPGRPLHRPGGPTKAQSHIHHFRDQPLMVSLVEPLTTSGPRTVIPAKAGIQGGLAWKPS